MSTVHRTSHFSADQIRHMKESAARQERIIGRIFWSNPDLVYSPSQIQSLVKQRGEHWPITSTRRAITNLTTAGILEKTDTTVKSKHNRPEHCWRWKRPEERPAQQATMFDEPPQNRNMVKEPV